MQIKFLRLTLSSNPAYPFQAGQVIETPRLTAEMKRWIKDGDAVLVRDTPETAVEPPGERAVRP